MHRLLERQIRRATRNGTLDTEQFLNLVDQVYRETDTDRERELRSSQLMSDELNALAAKIRDDSEQKLRDANSQLNLAVVASGAGLWDWRVSDNRIRVSSDFLNLLGYDKAWRFRKQMLSGGLASLLHPDESNRVLVSFERIAHGDALNMIVRLRHFGGSYRWFHVTGRAMALDGASAGLIAGAIIDVTAQQMAERNLASAIDSLTEAFVLFDADDRLQIWNKRYEEIFPYLAGFLRRGMTFAEIVEHTAKVAPIAARDGGGRHDWAAQRMYHHRNPGQSFEQELDGNLIYKTTERRTASGGIILIVRDVTDDHAQARSINLAKEQAQAADRAKSEFLAVMSHEIRTPLNGVMGMLRQLEKTGLSGAGAEWLSLARKSANHLLDIVNDVLDLSKLEAGALELNHENFDISQLCDDIVSVMMPRAAENGTLLIYTPGNLDRRWLWGDSSRIRQVLINLIGNAIKFTRGGRVDVQVSSSLGDDGQIRLHCDVRDTGIGVPDEAKHRLFSNFSQADSSTTRKFGGTGLGLAICRRIVERMGGTIDFSSTEGVGSHFWFDVYCRPGLPAAEAKAQLDYPYRSLRILVAEDNEINQQLVQMMLNDAGHQCRIVSNGTEAVIAVQEGSYDLVLMDVQMPGMDGPTATREIRALQHPSAMVPVIALTANAFADQKEAYLRAGMNDRVTKPIDPALLDLAIARLCHVSPGIHKMHQARASEKLQEADPGEAAAQQAAQEALVELLGKINAAHADDSVRRPA